MRASVHQLLHQRLGWCSEDGNTLRKLQPLQKLPRSQLKVRTGPAGIHLFDRTTGLNVLMDEARLPSNLWAAAPRQVSVALTNACDLACPHCYAPKNPAALPFERVTCQMYPNIGGKTITMIAAHTA
jgi:hypothetical protein